MKGPLEVCDVIFNRSLKWFVYILVVPRSSHRWCSKEKLFLKILQYLQENICVGVSFQ